MRTTVPPGVQIVGPSSENRSTVSSSGGACTSTGHSEVGDLHRHLGGAGTGTERAAVDGDVHLDHAVVVVDPHVGGHRAELGQLVAHLGRCVGQLVDELGVVDRRAVVRGVLAGDGVVADLLDVAREALQVLETLRAAPFAPLGRPARRARRRLLLQLVEAHVHPLLAAAAPTRTAGRRSSCRWCRRRSAPRSTPTTGRSSVS